jgi:type VI secretion system secreted protein Hcp
MAIYVQYAAIKGDVTESNHTGWVEVNSFQWGVGRGISAPVGGTQDREASTPSVSEIVCTKDEDVATIALLNEALQGEGKDVTIDFTKTDSGGGTQVYLSYTLNNTMISGYSISGAGGDSANRPQESLSFNFTKVACTATSMDPTNGTVGPGTVTYDLSLAKVV